MVILKCTESNNIQLSLSDSFLPQENSIFHIVKPKSAIHISTTEMNHQIWSLDLCPLLLSALIFWKHVQFKPAGLKLLNGGDNPFNLWKSTSLRGLVLSNNKMCPKLKQIFSGKPLPHSNLPKIFSEEGQCGHLTYYRIPEHWVAFHTSWAFISPCSRQYCSNAALPTKKPAQTFPRIPADNLNSSQQPFPSHLPLFWPTQCGHENPLFNLPLGIMLSELSQAEKDKYCRI